MFKEKKQINNIIIKIKFMTSQNKILFKQTFLLTSIAVLFYFLGFLGDYATVHGGLTPIEDYIVFFVHLFLMLLFFTPITIIYALRIKKNINLKWLNLIFKIFCWLSILTLLPFFIFGIYESAYYSAWGPEASFFENLWFSIQLADMDSLINFLYYSPFLIAAGLFYWAIRINRNFISLL